MLAALLALALAEASTPPVAPDSQPIEVVEAGHLNYEVGPERVMATGGVVLKRGLVLLRAQRANYDVRTGEVDAWGEVLLTEPGRALSAHALHAVLDGPYRARDVVMYLKDAPLDLARCKTIDEARGAGRNRFIGGGEAIVGAQRDPTLEVEAARITLCDCGGGPPSWQVRARSATVVPGDHVWLRWPTIYVSPRFLLWPRELFGTFDAPAPIPILPLPFLYLPLKERQTGLLLPELALGGNNGTVVSQPLFITMGPSYDATVAADYVFGPSAGQLASAGRGVKGPGVDLEFRWAPEVGTSGKAHLSLIHSTLSQWPAGAARPPGDNRIAFSLLHEQRVSERSYFKADLGLVQDPYYTTDFNTDQLLRVTDYRRSAVAWTYRRDDLLLEADAAYLLPLLYLDESSACSGTSCLRAPFGLFGSDVPIFHRLPAASATLLPFHFDPHFTLSVTGSIARFAPIHGGTGDEGADGVGPGEHAGSTSAGWTGWPGASGPGFGACASGVSPCDATEGDGQWQSTERLAALRALSRVELRAPLNPGGAVTVEPWAIGTGMAYAFAEGQGGQANAHGTAGLTLASRLSRHYGRAEAPIRHDVQPQIALALGTPQAGPHLPNYAYDEQDVAAPLAGVASGEVVPVRRTLSALPGGGFTQLQLTLRNRLSLLSGGHAQTSLDLTLGQDVDVGAGRFSETWARGLFRIANVSADFTARFLAFGATLPAGSGAITSASRDLHSDFWDSFTSLQGQLRVGDARGDDLHAGIVAVGKGGSPQLLAGLESFFDTRPMAFDAMASGSVGAVGKLSGLSVVYDASYYARSLAAPPCTGKSTAPHFYQHAASFVWDSPCHCWKAGVSVVINECLDAPAFKFLIDLSSLSERGFGR